MPHHPILFYGHHRETFRRFARLLKIDWIENGTTLHTAGGDTVALDRFGGALYAVAAWATVTGMLAAGCASDDNDNARSAGQTTHPASIDRLRLSGGDYGYPSPFAYQRGAGLILASYIFDTLLWEDSTGDPIPHQVKFQVR